MTRYGHITVNNPADHAIIDNWREAIQAEEARAMPDTRPGCRRVDWYSAVAWTVVLVVTVMPVAILLWVALS